MAKVERNAGAALKRRIATAEKDITQAKAQLERTRSFVAGSNSALHEAKDKITQTMLDLMTTIISDLATFSATIDTNSAIIDQEVVKDPPLNIPFMQEQTTETAETAPFYSSEATALNDVAADLQLVYNAL